jgi:hypothetical protein
MTTLEIILIPAVVILLLFALFLRGLTLHLITHIKKIESTVNILVEDTKEFPPYTHNLLVLIKRMVRNPNLGPITILDFIKRKYENKS